MLSYFDDESLSVIDICNQIIFDHFDFAFSILKSRSGILKIEYFGLTAIKLLQKYVY
jgi:hypothetical protein